MAKNITIAEGSQAKNFNTVHKLRTNLIGGGTQYWVPEDEAGAYANLSQKSITANGTYRASDDSKDGYSQVTVNVPPTRPNLTTKSISQNGSYRAIDDGADGFSQVNVNVAGVGEATVTLDEPIGGDGNEHHISANPTTGKPVDTVLPSSITITTMPTKTIYTNGERIDLTGIVVKAYKNDATIWESTGYTGGIIPINELVLESNIATIEGSGSIKTDGDGLNVLETTFSPAPMVYPNEQGYRDYLMSDVLGSYNGMPLAMASHFPETGAAPTLYFTRHNNVLYAYRVNNTSQDGLQPSYQSGFGIWERIYQGGKLSVQGQWVNAIIIVSPVTANQFSFVPESSINPTTGRPDRLRPSGMMVKIKWARPKDGKELMAAYPITVNPAS